MHSVAKHKFWLPPAIVAAVMLFAYAIPAYASTLLVSTTSLPQGEIAVAYSQTLTASGGTSPYTFAVTTGSLPAGLTLNTSTGAILGTPTAAGPSDFTVQVTDSASNTATQALAITVSSAGTLAITTTSLSPGQVNSTYAQSLIANGGTVPYAWSITVGSLPAGLTLNPATGLISGTPTAAGTTSFTVQVADNTANVVTGALSIVVNPAGTLMVTTASAPAGQVGVGYSQTLTATGGTLPYAWTVTAGALPAGLGLNASTGVISGTPTTAETASFTVQVADSATHTATQPLSIVVNPAGTLMVTTTSLASGQTGVAYAQTLTAVGGTTPYTWSILMGTLPAGLTLNPSTGVINGTPIGAGTASMTVQVADSAAHTAIQALSITINPVSALTVTTATLAAGQVGVGYSQMLVATGGTTPYTWTVTVGGLPAGLVLNTSTGVISGTPTTAGTTSFTVQVADSATHTATQPLSILVNPAGTLMVTTTTLPDGQVGVGYVQTLTAIGGTTPYVWSITAGGLPVGLALDGATGIISGTPTTVGATSFTVQVADSAAHVATQALSITVGTTPVGGTLPGLQGLCNAYFRGSEKGLEHKRQAAPFQALAAAAEAANMDVDDFCEQALSESNVPAAGMTDDDDDDEQEHEKMTTDGDDGEQNHGNGHRKGNSQGKDE